MGNFLCEAGFPNSKKRKSHILKVKLKPETKEWHLLMKVYYEHLLLPL